MGERERGGVGGSGVDGGTGYSGRQTEIEREVERKNAGWGGGYIRAFTPNLALLSRNGAINK